MKQIKHLILLVSVLGGLRIAHADDASAAYARGKAAMKAKKIREACDAFAESEKLKAAVETEVTLADCLEQDGKLVAAAKLYRTASDKDTVAKRKKTSVDKAVKLEARAPKLRFAINPKPDGIAIKVDGIDVAATGDVMVDLGPHEVVATAPGFEGHANAAVDREGQILDVILRMESTAPPPAPEPAPAPAPAPEPAPVPAPALPAMAAPEPQPVTTIEEEPSNRKNHALIVGSVGVVALVAGVVFFGVGTNMENDEDGVCPGRPGHICASDADVAKANSLRDDGRMYRGMGIGAGIGGVVLLAAGVIMYATAPGETAPVALHVDQHGAGVAYTFGF